MIVLSERARTIVRIILALAVVAGVSVAMYFLFFRAKTEPSPVDTGAPGQVSGTFPDSGRAQLSTSTEELVQGGLGGTAQQPTTPTQPQQVVSTPGTSVLVQTPVQNIAPGTAQNTGPRFYNGADGKFYRVGADGELVALSDKAFYGVSDVDWGNTSDKAILEFPDGSNVYFNFEEGRQVTLPKHWEDFAFSGDDAQIVGKNMGNNESNRFLFISNPDGSDVRPIQELGNNGNKVHTAWAPNNQIVAYAHTGDELGFNREQIVLIGKNQENLPGLITEGRGFIPSWSPTGNRLLYSVYTSENGYLPELWISGGTAEAINSGRRRIELSTWADKCAWQSDELLYCAVPEYLGVGAALQRDVVEKGPDQMIRINIKTGAKTNLGFIENVNDARHMQLAPDGKTAFFQNGSTGQLVSMPLSTP